MITLLNIFGSVSISLHFGVHYTFNAMSVARALATPLHGGDALTVKEREKEQRRINTGIFRMTPAGVRDEAE